MQVFQVDAFTTRPFSGNPAGVCILEQEAAEDWMQAVAAEMNLSETAFLVPSGREFDLRWFTPVCEVELCGHATLAAAHVLWETGKLRDEEEARFRTSSGLLTAKWNDSRIELDFPSEAPDSTNAPPGLLEGLGVSAVYVGRNRMDYLVEVASESVLRDLKPDFSRLRQVDARGIIVTSRSWDERCDFVSRFFAPAVGVDEDPVTGSAHCCLAPYWGKRLGKTDLSGHQVSRRGGEIGMTWKEGRVRLSGSAVTVMVCKLAPAALPPEQCSEAARNHQRRMEEQFSNLAGQIDLLLGRLEGDAKVGYDRLSVQLRNRQSVMERKLVEFRTAGSGAWREMRPGLERAWRELRKAFERLSERR